MNKPCKECGAVFDAQRNMRYCELCSVTYEDEYRGRLEAQREWLDAQNRPIERWWSDEASDDAAVLDEIHRAGIVQGHRPEQPPEPEIQLLSAVVRMQIRQEEREALRAKPDPALEFYRSLVADPWSI